MPCSPVILKIMEFSDEHNIVKEDAAKKLSEIKTWLLTALNNLTTNIQQATIHMEINVLE